MTKNMKKFALATVCALGLGSLTGCDSEPERKEYSELDFSSVKNISVDQVKLTLYISDEKAHEVLTNSEKAAKLDISVTKMRENYYQLSTPATSVQGCFQKASYLTAFSDGNDAYRKFICENKEGDSVGSGFVDHIGYYKRTSVPAKVKAQPST